MVKTLSRGIRLPVDLWDLVKIADPALSYSQIVKCALLEKYCIDIDSDDSGFEPAGDIPASDPDLDRIEHIRYFIDNELGC